MTITAGDTRTILTSADPDRADTQQAWDLAVGHDPAAIGRTKSANNDAADGTARARGRRIAAQGTGRNPALLGGGGPVALWGLARGVASRVPPGNPARQAGPGWLGGAQGLGAG